MLLLCHLVPGPDFCHFNYNVSWYGSLCLEFLFPGPGCVSFPRLGMYSAIRSSIHSLPLPISLIYDYLSLSLFTHSVVSDSCDPMDCSPPSSSVHGISQEEYWSGLHFLLQGIFLTQESNLGLLYCRQILHRLSYEGSPTCGSLV